LISQSFFDKQSRTDLMVYVNKKYLWKGGTEIDPNKLSDYKNDRQKYKDMFIYSSEAIVSNKYVKLDIDLIPVSHINVLYSNTETMEQIQMLPDGSVVLFDLNENDYYLLKGLSLIYLTETLSNGAGAIVDAAQVSFGFWATFKGQHEYINDATYDDLLERSDELTAEQEKALENSKDLLKNAYKILDIKEKEIFLRFIYSVDKTYLNLNHLNFLKQLSDYQIELRLDDFIQVGALTGNSKFVLPAKTFEATTGGRIKGVVIIQRIEDLINYLMNPANGYRTFMLSTWTKYKPLKMVKALAESYSNLPKNPSITGLSVQEQVNRLIEFIGPFAFVMFLVNGFDLTQNIGFFVNNFDYNTLSRRIRDIGISFSQQDVLLTSILTYRNLKFKRRIANSLNVKIDNILTKHHGKIRNVFRPFGIVFGGKQEVKMFSYNILNKIRTNTFNKLKMAVFDWIDETYRGDEPNRIYYRRESNSMPSRTLYNIKDNILWQIVKAIDKLLPTIQGHHLVVDGEGGVDVYGFEDERVLDDNDDPIDRIIKLDADLLYDLNLVKLKSKTISEVSIYSSIRYHKDNAKYLQLYRPAVFAIRNCYDNFYQEFTPFLEKVARDLNGLTYTYHDDSDNAWKTISCDGHTLYFDITEVKIEGVQNIVKFRSIRTFAYSHKSMSFFKLDFNKQGSAEFESNMFKLFSALFSHYSIRIFGFNMNKMKQLHRSRLLAIFDDTGVIYDYRDLFETPPTPLGHVYTLAQENAISGQYLENFGIELHNKITNFVSQSSISITLPSMPYKLQLSRINFIKSLLNLKEDRRIKFFMDNIDYDYIEAFNEYLSRWEKMGLVPESILVKWNDWYRDYINRGNPIGKDAIKQFFSIMIENWDDDWYEHPEKYDFDNDGTSYTYAPIEFNSWFRPEFMVLYKYFPNVQHADSDVDDFYYYL